MQFDMSGSGIHAYLVVIVHGRALLDGNARAFDMCVPPKTWQTS